MLAPCPGVKLFAPTYSQLLPVSSQLAAVWFSVYACMAVELRAALLRH